MLSFVRTCIETFKVSQEVWISNCIPLSFIVRPEQIVLSAFTTTVSLLKVNGERPPDEVYLDFKKAVMKILGLSEDEENLNPESVEAEVSIVQNETKTTLLS